MNGLRFAFRMALRELRRGRRKFIFFLLCIAIGVAGLVGIRGFNANLQSALLKEARTLMAADMTVSFNRDLSAEQAQYLRGLSERGVTVVHNTETASMAINPTSKNSQLVELKAVEAGYPFYGVLELDPAGTKLTDETALVGAELLDRLSLKIGDTMQVGSTTFTIAGVIAKEPDRVTAGFGIGPRVMITQKGLERAKLIQLGSRARQIWLLKLQSDEQVEGLRTELREHFAEMRPRIADFREAQPQVKRFLDRMTAFLSLVSMVALLIGGLGVANATRVFVNQKLDSIAIMKCVGATNRRVVLIYLTQMLLLSLAGSVLGILLGYAIQLAMPRVVGSFLDLTLEITLSGEVALQGIVVGLLTSILFTLLPLGAIADVKPALVFRRDMAQDGRRRWSVGRFLRQGIPLAGIGIGLAGIAAWLSGNLRWGIYFMAGLAGAVLILGGASWLAVWLVRRLRVPQRWLTVRQGLASLHRPGSQASAVVLALGVGVTMVLAVYLLQRGLMAEVNLTSPAGSPNMFFLGLQTRETGPFTEMLRAHPGVETVPDPIPMARARLQRVDGKSKDEVAVTEANDHYWERTVSLSYSEKVPQGSEVAQGRWWESADYQSKALISVDTEAARDLNLHIGSVLELEQEGGVLIKGEVFNIREIKDFRAGGAFNFVFSPGTLEKGPVNYLGQARIKPGAASEIQKEVVTRYPAVTVINLNDVLEMVGSILDRIGVVIRFVAGFSVAAGLIILASSIAATKFRRTREAVLFKTLGATRGRVWRIFAMEYTVLGLVAGLVGTGLAVAAAWVVLTQVMEVKYKPEALPLLAGVGITVLLTVTVGVISTLDVLKAKPLQVLREE